MAINNCTVSIAFYSISHFFSQFFYGEFTRVAHVHWSSEVIVGVHEAYHQLDQVIDIAERTGLVSLAVNGDGFTFKGLDYKVGDDATVIGMHIGAVGIKKSADPDVDLMLPMIVEK